MIKGNKIVDVRQHCFDRYVPGQEHGEWEYYLIAILEDGREVRLDREKVRAASGQQRLTEPAARRTCVGKDVGLFI